MEKFFKAQQRGSSVGQELRAGLTTFLAMAYIIAVNPSLLTAAGIPATAAVTATCVGAGIMTICMGLFSNRPLACASGMGVNAVFAFSLTAIAGGDWHAASAVIFIEGIAILILVLCGLREAIMDAIPVSLRHAISVGLGLFIAMIGLKDGGIIVADESTMVALGDVFSPTFLVGLISIVATIVLYAMNVKGSLLLGIIVAVVAGIPLGVTQLPAGIVSGLDFSSFGAPFLADESGVMGIAKVVTNPTLLVFAFSLMMSDFFDTMGTAMAVAKQGEFLEADGRVRNIKEILVVDSAAAAVGGLVGASSITTFVESGAGVAEGGKTGLTALTTAVLFFLSIFLLPLFAFIPSQAAACALIYVGVLMMSNVKHIDFEQVRNAVPAFFTIIIMPLGYSITDGIGMGLLLYVVISLVEYVVAAAVAGAKKLPMPKFDIPIVTFIVAIMFAAYFFIPTSF